MFSSRVCGGGYLGWVLLILAVIGLAACQCYQLFIGQAGVGRGGYLGWVLLVLAVIG